VPHPQLRGVKTSSNILLSDKDAIHRASYPSMVLGEVTDEELT
jgi:hypothetical protein